MSVPGNQKYDIAPNETLVERVKQLRCPMSRGVHCMALIIGGDVFGHTLILWGYCSHIEWYVRFKIVQGINTAGGDVEVEGVAQLVWCKPGWVKNT